MRRSAGTAWNAESGRYSGAQRRGRFIAALSRPAGKGAPTSGRHSPRSGRLAQDPSPGWRPSGRLTACGKTHTAFDRRSIPAKQPVMKPARRSAGDPSRLTRRCAPLIVAFRSKYTRYSSLTRLVSHAPRRPRRSRGFHHRLFTASLRAAHRCVSVEIHPVFLPHAPCQPGASPVSALTWVSPQAVRAPARPSPLHTGPGAEAPGSRAFRLE